MRIGLNAQILSTPNPAGPEMFAKKIYRALAQVDHQNNYVLYFEKEPTSELIQFLTSGNPNFSHKVLPKKLSWTQISLAHELLKNPVDVFFTPQHTIPGLVTIFTLGKFNPVTMIHGLEYRSNKNTETSLFSRIMHPFVLWWTTTFSKIIVVPSEATRKAIMEDALLKVPEKKIRIISEGVEEVFFRVSSEEIAQTKKKFNLADTPYLFYVGTVQPRKNIPATIKAFSMAKEEGQLKELKLLLAGKLGWNFQESIDAPKKYGVESEVEFLKWLPDKDLHALLAGSEGYVNFSREEGFGLTLVEAFAAGVPVAVSDIPAHRELGTQHPIYANPNNVEDIKQALVSLTKRGAYDPEPARQHARNYTWETAAQRLTATFKNFSKNP
jgi:glycosyltransferase involved in cell wall biosynthesis